MTSSPSTFFLVDGYNLFIRSYMAYPQMNKNGEHVGGIVGFIKKLSEISSVFLPEKIYIIWEGGGSSKRKSIRPDYKERRTPTKLNRFYKDDLPDSVNNQLYQLQLLVSLNKFLPFCQIYLENLEGDDVIGFLSKNRFLNQNKIILSSDKDMYQLLDDKTSIWDFGLKKIINQNNVFEEFRVNPKHFGLLKTICGDVSDNIKGIKGLGYKKAVKLFPLLSTNEDVLLEDLINYAAARTQESEMFKRCYEMKEFLRENWQLIDITRITLSHQQIQKLDYLIDNFVPDFDIYQIKKFFLQNFIDIDSNLFELIVKLSYARNTQK
jgi:5'-3' exonuclease